MSLNDLKAEFSYAYVRAVAHAAGYFVQEANRPLDGDGVDLTIFRKSAGGVVRSPRLDLQVKATSAAIMDDPFVFDLLVKNYDELRSEHLQVPRILVVVSVPSDVSLWISATEQELIMRHCGYWKSLRSEAATENEASIRIRISRSACFHVDKIHPMMERIRQGGLP